MFKTFGLIVIFAPFISSGKQNATTFKQDWGYVTVREHAHMFWWLYYTTDEVFSYTERPLIIWLQGGPGMASSGYGNFLELGPLDVDFKRRNHSIIEKFNILFVDNPVDVGYSHTSSKYANVPNNNEEIGQDLIAFAIKFFDQKTDMRNMSVYIFGESYGGKMTVEFAYQLMEHQRNANISICNLKGIGLGNSYISPIDYITNYASIALQLGLVDGNGYGRIDKLAKQVAFFIRTKDYVNATDMEKQLTATLASEIQGVDMYNLVTTVNQSLLPSFLKHSSQLTEVMNNDSMKLQLSIPDEVEWKYINSHVYLCLEDDLLRTVTNKVEHLLNNTNIKVLVYNGVLDILVNTAGTRLWMDKLNWKSKTSWQIEPQVPFEMNTAIEGYIKRLENLILYVIFRAGHSVPQDNAAAFQQMLLNELVS